MAKTVKSVVKRQVRRTAKRNPAAVIVLIVVLGGGAQNFKAVIFTVGDGDGSVTLQEDGWTLTALGRDAAESVSVETDLQKTDGGYVVPTDEPGIYRIVYRPTHFLFSKYSLVRTVTVNAAEGGDE